MPPPTPTSSSPPPVMLRNPGVSLVGRRVSKLFKVEDVVGYRVFNGTVRGCRNNDAFGPVYVVRYDEDGDEEELFYEELMLILSSWDTSEFGSQPIPQQVLECMEFATHNTGISSGSRWENVASDLS
jgi:hypothetical protein